MNTTIRTILEEVNAFGHFSEEDALLLLSFLYEGTFESFASALDEKMHDGKCTLEQKQQLLAQYTLIHTKLKEAFAIYTATVNEAYHKSFIEVIESEYKKQSSRLASLEQQYKSLIKK